MTTMLTQPNVHEGDLRVWSFDGFTELGDGQPMAAEEVSSFIEANWNSKMGYEVTVLDPHRVAIRNTSIGPTPLIYHGRAVS